MDKLGKNAKQNTWKMYIIIKARSIASYLQISNLQKHSERSMPQDIWKQGKYI